MHKSESAEGDETVARTGGRLLTRNAIWNMAGIAVPLLVGIGTIPYLIEQIGMARFGILSLLWILITYLVVFDLGLMQATSHVIARRLSNRDREGVVRAASTANIACMALGMGAAVLLVAVSPWIADVVTGDDRNLYAETIRSVWIVAGSLPWTVGALASAGTLHGLQEFRPYNVARIALNSWTFLGPALVASMSSELPYVVAAILVGRLANWYALRVMVRRRLPRGARRFDRKDAGELLRFGRWLAVSKAVGPITVYFDRFVISSVLGPVAVSLYVAPFEIVYRLLAFPQSIVQVLMPAMTMRRGREGVEDIVRVASEVLVAGTGVVALALVLWATPALNVWLGPEFTAVSATVLQLLSIGLVGNAVAAVFVNHIFAVGRTDIVAGIHLAEIVPYAVALWWAIGAHGLAGVAAVWSVRILADALFFGIISARLDRALIGTNSRIGAVVAAWFTALAVMAVWTPSGPMTGVAVAAGVIGAAWMAWPHFQLWRQGATAND